MQPNWLRSPRSFNTWKEGFPILPLNSGGENAYLLRLHHVGFVVHDIESRRDEFARSLNACWKSEIFHDPLQKVRVTFLATERDGAQIELVEPAGEDSPVRAFLERGGGLHH